MKAELKEIVFVNPNMPNGKYSPEDEEYFGETIYAMIGPKGEDSSDIFELFICSPKWISKNYSNQGYIWGINMLVLLNYNLQILEDAINKYISPHEARDWSELVSKIKGVGRWEFEDYQE